jgi:hypothetical protein
MLYLAQFLLIQQQHPHSETHSRKWLAVNTTMAQKTFLLKFYVLGDHNANLVHSCQEYYYWSYLSLDLGEIPLPGTESCPAQRLGWADQ